MTETDRTTPAPSTSRSGDDAAEERLSVLKTYKLYVGGAFPRTESGRTERYDGPDGRPVANVCRASRKDLREAVEAARGAQRAWAARSAYNRAQILYRIAEMLEGRRAQFVTELEQQGTAAREAGREVDVAVDRLVHHAGWADKIQQVFGAVNPVASSHFNFTLLEPTGVVAIVAPGDLGLLGLVSVVAPAIVCGNTCVVLASERQPLTAVTFGEVLHVSDLPGGVVNLLTGRRDELAEHFARHMDVNALVLCDVPAGEAAPLRVLAADNVKRVVRRSPADWFDARCESPEWILDTLEAKTTWHPVGT